MFRTTLLFFLSHTRCVEMTRGGVLMLLLGEGSLSEQIDAAKGGWGREVEETEGSLRPRRVVFVHNSAEVQAAAHQC